jgi:hypothetical protein
MFRVSQPASDGGGARWEAWSLGTMGLWQMTVSLLVSIGREFTGLTT